MPFGIWLCGCVNFRPFSKCNCSLTGVPSAWQAQMCGGAALHSSRLQPLAVAHRTLEAGDRAPPPGVSSRVVSPALSCLVARVLWPGPRRLVARPSGPSPRLHGEACGRHGPSWPRLSLLAPPRCGAPPPRLLSSHLTRYYFFFCGFRFCFHFFSSCCPARNSL